MFSIFFLAIYRYFNDILFYSFSCLILIERFRCPAECNSVGLGNVFASLSSVLLHINILNWLKVLREIMQFLANLFTVSYVYFEICWLSVICLPCFSSIILKTLIGGAAFASLLTFPDDFISWSLYSYGRYIIICRGWHFAFTLRIQTEYSSLFYGHCHSLIHFLLVFIQRVFYLSFIVQI